MFIRTAGCSLGCPECDTKPSWKSKNKLKVDDKEVDEVAPMVVVNEVQAIDPNTSYICITGGEPLEQDQESIVSLIDLLRLRFPFAKIVVETSGAYPVHSMDAMLSSKVNNRCRSNVVNFCLDWKPPSTGLTNRMILQNFNSPPLAKGDYLKIVCKNEEDFYASMDFLRSIYSQLYMGISVFFHGMEGTQSNWLARIISQTDLEWCHHHLDLRFGVQLHKIVGLR